MKDAPHDAGSLADRGLDPHLVLGTVGRATPDAWIRARGRKRSVPQRRRPALERLSPRQHSRLAKSDAGIFLPRGDTPALEVRPVENPAPGASFGFAGVFASIETEATFLDGFLVLKTDPGAIAHLRADTLRLFRWDEARRRFEPVRHTHADTGSGFVAGRIARGGTYALIGLHVRPEVVDTLRIACALRGRAMRLPADARTRLKERICELILCVRDLPQGASGRDVVFPGGDPCRQCIGVPTDAFFDLPECFILDDRLPCRDGPWESLGPFEIVGTPTQAFNRGIGCAKQLAFDPADRRRIYATGEHGGVWVLHRSDEWPDGRWAPIGDTLEGLQMRALAVARSDADRLYAGNGLGFVYASPDRGASWSRTSNTNFGFIRRILVHRSDADTLFLAANSGLHLSADRGATWTPILDPATFPAPDVLDAAMDPDDSSVLYIGVRAQGVFKSYDSGRNWDAVLPFGAAAEPGRQMIRLALGERNADGSRQSDADRTVAVKFGREVFVGADGGRTPPQSVGRRGGGGGNRRRSDGGLRDGEWCNALAVDPRDPAVILAGQQDLFKTTDGGASWRRISGNDSTTAPDNLGNPDRLVHEDFQDIVFDPDMPGIAWLACDGGLYLYRDGRADDPVNGDAGTESFEERNLGFATSQLFRAGVQGAVAVGNLDHNGIKGTTDLASGQWQKANRRGGNNALEFAYIYADPKRTGRFYTVQLAGGGGQLGRLRFPGTGDPRTDLLPYAPFSPYFSNVDPLTNIAQFASLPVGPIAVDVRPDSEIVLACAQRTTTEGFRLMLTADGAADPDVDAAGNPTGLPTWVTAFDNADDPLVCVVFAPSSPGTVYVISAAGRTFARPEVAAGAADANWEARGQWNNQTDVRQIVVNCDDAQRVYAVSGTDFGRSTDGGRTWPAAGITSPPGRELNSIAAHPRDPPTLFIGADTGVFISYDEGATWSAWDDGLPNAEVMQVFVDGAFLYAISHGRGLWRRRFC